MEFKIAPKNEDLLIFKNIYTDSDHCMQKIEKYSILQLLSAYRPSDFFCLDNILYPDKS